MVFKINDKSIHTNQNLAEVQAELAEYNLTITKPENSNEIIFHGKLLIREINQEVVVHLYFDKEENIITSMVLHSFPIDFNKIQLFLEQQYQVPNDESRDHYAKWVFKDGEVTHQIVDRFGDEEMIYIRFS